MIPTLNVFIFFLPESLLLEWLCKTYTCLQEKYLVGVSLGSPADQLRLYQLSGALKEKQPITVYFEHMSQVLQGRCFHCHLQCAKPKKYKGHIKMNCQISVHILILTIHTAL